MYGICNKYQVYVKENETWEKFINLQYNEVPELEKLLQEVPAKESEITKKNKTFFQDSFQQQQNIMKEVNAALTDQQKRLNGANSQIKGEEDEIDMLCRQDILREKIKEVEKKYLELKCNFMTYLSSVLP